MDIREVSILSSDAQALIARLDAELSAEYAPEDMHGVDLAPFHDDGGHFMIVYEGDSPAGCGALRPLSDSEVELKRMFVAEPYRGRGLARSILGALEEKARAVGFARVLLETGDQQHAAIHLYHSSGYQRVEPFGEYIGGQRSVCFAKDLRVR